MSAVLSIAISDAAGGWCGGLREKGEQSIESKTAKGDGYHTVQAAVNKK